jgi:diguanylate cyclase (GGDEF)-like protein
MVFLGLSSALFQLTLPELARLSTLIVVTNVLGAMASYRISRIMREEYREHLVLRGANRRLQESYAERLRLEDALRRKAEIDDVTGIANRSTFFEDIERLSIQDGGLPTPLSLLLLDIDYFRQINGTYGHLRSDGLLRALVSVCQSLLAKGQTIARIGGEEFVVLLPGVELAEAGHLAERIREECARTPVAMGDVFVHFTVSIGVVHHRGGEAFNMMLRRVDEAVAAAKFKGRNRIEVVA